MRYQIHTRSTVIMLLLASLSSLPVFAKSRTRASATPLKSCLFQGSSPWQDFTPGGEEFSVLMPQPPHVSRGTKYFYLNRNVLVSFSVYSVFHNNTLFVIQSYESTKPKELVKQLLWPRKKSLTFGRDLELNGYKGKSFTQTGEGFSNKGQYFIAHNHFYIVEAAKRDAFDPAIDQFLNSFKLQAVYAPLAKPVTPASNSSRSQAPLEEIHSPQDVTRKVIILSEQEPGYTEEARDSHVTGTVTLKVTLSSSGHVDDLEVLSGLPKGLTEQAIEASKTIIFIPAEKDGKPVSVRVQVEYSFMLT